MNVSVNNNFNDIQHRRCKCVQFLLIFVLPIILFIFSLIILSSNSSIILPILFHNEIKLTSNPKLTEYNTDKQKTSIQIEKKSKFSKFRCTGDENNINAWPERLCVFNNICYNTNKQQFEYYRRLHNPKYPLFYDSYKGILTDFSQGDGFVALTSRRSNPWAPSVIDQSYPTENVTWLKNLHTLWRGYFSENLGHVIWEDIGSIFYSLERMNEYDDDLMIMNFTPVPTNSEFVRFRDNILAALTTKELLEYKSYLKTYKTDYVCFERFIVGGNFLFFHDTVMKELHGRESLLFKWRSKIISFHKFHPNFIPIKHQIVITNKSQSIWAKASNGMHRAIANLKEVEQFIRKTYPKIPVHVVEWHKMSFIKQIELLLHTTILISPTGGISLIAPFLPYGSHAIIMDYYVTQNGFGFKTGASASMDGMLLNHFPHFKKDYYQIYNRNDYVFDFEGATDTRNDASILINMTRLHILMESAMEDMDL